MYIFIYLFIFIYTYIQYQPTQLLPQAKPVSAIKRKLIDDSDEKEERELAEGEQTIQDPVTAEMDRWKAVLGESLDTYKAEDGLLFGLYTILLLPIVYGVWCMA